MEPDVVWKLFSTGSTGSPHTEEIGRRANPRYTTVSDRVGQAVIKSYLESIVEPKFHEDSYGYRPGKSALNAVGVARKRCWRLNWCIDLDIKGFFDNLDHALMMKAVKFHTDEKWIHLYVERWLKAPLQRKDGEMIKREKGTPQGGLWEASHKPP